MKIIQLFSIVALLQGSTSSAADYTPVEIINDASTQAYPPVEIINTTPFHAKGTMKFAACSNDNYRKVTPVLRPAPDKVSQKRGLCLLTSLSGCPDARDVPECDAVDCKRYSSSGTSYSKFALIQLGTCKFEVTRRVTLTDQQDELLVDDNDNETTGTKTSTSDDTEAAYEQGLRGNFRQQKVQAN